jgi:hypothetical protein
MAHTVRTVGPLQAPKDRGSSYGESKACAFGSSERPASRQVNRLERHAGKLARVVLRGLDGSNPARLPGVMMPVRRVYPPVPAPTAARMA